MNDKNKSLVKTVALVFGWVVAAVFIAFTIFFAAENARLKNEIANSSGAAEAKSETYDFYITLGTMPTLYATLNAYANKNPNTYMWFYRGNTLSYQYSGEFIRYFDFQSKTNANSEINYVAIRDKVREIRTENPAAKFRLFCDDLRVRFIADIFVAAGVDFEDMQVTLLSDGTGTYSMYDELTEEAYVSQAEEWRTVLKAYTDRRDDENFCYFSEQNGQAMEMQSFAFYVSTFDNVSYWMQHPDYLICENSNTLAAQRNAMNIIKKDPKAMYNALDEATRTDYRKAILANALVDSDTLHTLDDAVNYFDSQLSGRDKETVLILGTSYNGLEHNRSFIDQTIAYYTPTRKGDGNTVMFKGREYVSSDETIVADGKTYKIGEISVYLFFKGHPAYPADAELQAYFKENEIVMLPHRTPVETLFWMYDVKTGGYQSTSFLSCSQGQTEFFYGEPTTPAIVTMKMRGFFDGTTVFEEKSSEKIVNDSEQ